MSYYTTYNREGERVTIMSTEDEKDCYLSLAYRELNELPRECIARLEHVQHLDLSNNKFSYPPKAHCYLACSTLCFTVRLLYEVINDCAQYS